MATTFYAVYWLDSGELFSLGTVVADEATLTKRGLGVKAFNGPQVGKWNPTKLDFEAEPVKAADPRDALEAKVIWDVQDVRAWLIASRRG